MQYVCFEKPENLPNINGNEKPASADLVQELKTEVDCIN
jgi:hypothetical protein